MRMIQWTAAVVALCSVVTISTAWGGEGCTKGCNSAAGGCNCAAGGCNSCDGCAKCGGRGCGGHLGGLLHCNRGYEGLDRHYNCQCNGSYKFPVPPLYTYHWPGIYSHQLMTEYHSPWRFPPIKPYSEEKLEPRDQREMLPPQNANSAVTKSPEVQQVDFAGPTKRPGISDLMSDKLKKLSRYNP